MLLDQLCNPGEITGKNEGIKNLKRAWFQAYEIGVDQRTRVERKYNLLQFANKQAGKFPNTITTSVEKENSSKISNQRGQMIHKTLKPEEQDTLVQLDLTEEEG